MNKSKYHLFFIVIKWIIYIHERYPHGYKIASKWRFKNGNKTKKRIWFNISVWVVIGAIAVMAVVSAVMTLAHFQRQKEQAVELLVEKGATLIRSFEAGLRSPLGMKDETFRLQKLLMETAQQPDIDYIIVTDNKGNIIADSDPSQVGDKYGLDLDMDRLLHQEIRWRQVANPEGAELLRFIAGFSRGKIRAGNKIRENNSKTNKIGNMIIYVGLDMASN